MDRIGQEFLLPTIQPADLWRESGRWTLMGDNMFRLKDRKGADLCLGMTHEEVMTDIARNELRSYKQLPQIWYQIQTKFRDEPRPKSGLLRVRQFIMKDSYSFDIDAASLDRSYDLHDAAYRAIFTRCGLKFVAVEADSGAMGGSQSQEFMVYTDAGEDLIASCAACGYAANMEKATSRLAPVKEMEPTGDGTPELVSTPGQASIVDITKFFDIESSSDIKCVAYMAKVPGKDEKNAQNVLKGFSEAKSEDKESLVRQYQSLAQQYLAALPWQPVVAFLRGDHFVNETKLLGVLGANDLRTMQAEELETWLHGPAGYLGPMNLDPAAKVNDGKLNVILDHGLENRRYLVCGANKLDHHYRNVVPGRDFQWTVIADIRNVLEGEACPQCGAPLKVARAVEVGHIFKLGDRYTNKMGARVLDANGKEVTPIMGCYGIGIERILTAAVEQGNDANGFWLPPSIAPFDVIVTITNVADAALKSAGEQIAADLEAAGFDVLLDDRDDRAGVKFKDADLIGVPYRVTVGKKVAEGKVELVERSTASARDLPRDFPIAGLATELRNLTLRNLTPGTLQDR
jgi:prolyl-tRNA synthetase